MQANANPQQIPLVYVAGPYRAPTLELLRRCDAVLLLDTWESSSGARGEKAEAERLGIPVFYCVEEVRGWMISREREIR